MTPTKFQHAGLDWIPHTPGDAIPCPPDTLVRVLMRGDLGSLCSVANYETSASIWDWDVCPTETMAEIIGWHPVEEQPSNIKQCANCRWSMALDHRYDQVRCCNPDSDDAYGDVEATHYCAHFEQPSLARRVIDLLEAGDTEQAKHELRKELE